MDLWFQFIASVLVGAIALWLPGVLLLRAVRVNRITAFTCAPVVSIVLFCVLGIIYAKVGVFTTAVSLLLPVTVGCALIYIAGSFIAKEEIMDNSVTRNDALALLFYVVAGIAFSLAFLYGQYATPADYVANYDSMHHFGFIREFVDSGAWTPFDASSYQPWLKPIMPIEGWSYYPDAWHVVGALMVSLLGVPVTLAANATNFTFLALVLPVSMFALLRYLFRDNPLAVVCGAFATFAFATFPWLYLSWGPLFPNLAAFALMPTAIFGFLSIFETGVSRKQRIAASVLFITGMVSLALAQPNAVFSAGVMLAPYIVYLASRIPVVFKVSSGTWLWRIVAGLAALALIAAIWMFLYQLPAFDAVVHHKWEPFVPLDQAIFRVLTVSFRETQPQLLLSIVLIVGVVQAFLKKRLRWLVVAYLYMIVAFVVVATQWGEIRSILAGFWYTDAARVAASACFYVIPLAAWGLATIAQSIGAASERIAVRMSGVAGWGMLQEAARGAAIAIVIALAFAINFCQLPNCHSRWGSWTAFGHLSKSVQDGYTHGDWRVYTDDEQDFVRKAKEITGDALVLNIPDDGSEFAYGTDGLETYNRYNGFYDQLKETCESRIIRLRLSNIATDKEVQAAVKATGARYVILLDAGEDAMRKNNHLWTYREEDWTGYNHLTDSTPGFKLLLADKDMRLYEIEPID